MREAIIAWVTKLKRKVFLVPEMTYAVPRLKPLLFDPLPDTIKPSVKVLDRYCSPPRQQVSMPKQPPF